MVKRPPVTETSFLGHIFGPSKHPLPTGLRKTTLKAIPGRDKRRVNAFNKLTAVKQELLKRAGLRESYLRKEASLADARNSLRPRAITLNVAKPVRPRAPKPAPVPLRAARLDAMVAEHLKRTVRAAGKHVNEQTVDEQMIWLDTGSPDMLRWDYGHIKYAGRKGSEYERFDDRNITHNPFWYH